MFSEYLNRTRKSLSFRLTLWYSAIFILSALFLFLIIYLYLASSMKKNDREIILLELKEVLAVYQKDGLDALRKEVDFEKHVNGKNPFLVRLEGSQNNTVFLNIPDQWTNFDLNQLEKNSLNSKKRWQYLKTKGEKDILEVASYSFSDGSLLQVGKSVASRNEFLKRFREIFTVIMIPVILFGFGGGVVLSIRAFHPIRNLINTTRSIIKTNKIDIRMPIGRKGDELAEMSMLFNTMLEKIETLIAGMRMGLDNVAHDLRTPITRLRGIAEMALHSEQNIDLLREALSDCIEESERILVMLNSLMDISEAETGVMKLNLEKVNISSLIEEAVDIYRFIAEEKNIIIHMSCPSKLYIDVDRSRLRQVLLNLLDNAIKYTPGDGKVDIEAYQRDQRIVVTIQDTGVGIPSGELPRIWDRLYRGDKSRSERGLGLGLSLVKAIVQAHKGQIEVTSKPDIGSLFTIYLPSKL